MTNAKTYENPFAEGLRENLKDSLDDFLYQKKYRTSMQAWDLGASESFVRGNVRLYFEVDRGSYFTSVTILDDRLKLLNIRFTFEDIYKKLLGLSEEEYKEKHLAGLTYKKLFVFFRNNHDDAISLVRRLTYKKLSEMEKQYRYREQRYCDKRYQKWLVLNNYQDCLGIWKRYLSAKVSPINRDYGDYKDLVNFKNVDAIVNETNNAMCGGEGLSGMVHRYAGENLLTECEKLGGCETGAAQITDGYRLPIKHIIHSVPPKWHGGSYGETELLSSCYQQIFKRAFENQVESIALPVLGCSTGNFPISLACNVAIREVSNALINQQQIKEVTFVCFSFDVQNQLIQAKVKAEKNQVF